MNFPSILKIAKKPLKKITIFVMIGLPTVMVGQAFAKDNTDTSIPMDLSGISVTKHEIAVMQILSEICPPMLNNEQKQRFYRSYNTQLHELMPTLEDPKAAIQYLSTQQDYRQILRSMRAWTNTFSHQENKALCEDLANASF